jgi:hypothetical protein
LTALVTHAHRDGLVLASLMAELHCESFAERRALIPAFIFFFPDGVSLCVGQSPGDAPPRRPQAAACWRGAKHCKPPGGIAAVRGQLIDVCALDV